MPLESSSNDTPSESSLGNPSGSSEPSGCGNPSSSDDSSSSLGTCGPDDSSSSSSSSDSSSSSGPSDPSDSSSSESSDGSDDCPNDYNFVTSEDDTASPKYRKIALNGRPLSDEKPQHTEETDQPKEESYIDALNLGLRHSVTDVYIPLVGGLLALSVRRNVQTEIWNNKNSILPISRVDRPFGSGWSSNLTANIEITHQQPTAQADKCLHLQPDYAYVTDETGSRYRFLVVRVQGQLQYLAIPTSQVEQEAHVTTLVQEGSELIFRKKFGTRLVFEGPPVTLNMASDATDPKFAYTESHSYYRLLSVTDRLGICLTYSYSTTGTLVPHTITANTGADQKITIECTGNLVDSVTDPNGKTIHYEYQAADQFKQLIKVTGAPSASGQPATEYGYEFADSDVDPVPPDPELDPRPLPLVYRHLNVSSISSRQTAFEGTASIYTFALEKDTSKKVYVSRTGLYYLKAGEPRWVKEVTLPDASHVVFAMNADMSYSGGGSVLQASRSTSVTDAQGFHRSYTFDNISVIFLDSFQAQLDVLQHKNALGIPRLVIFKTLTVTHAGFGTETFTFNLEAGLALESVTDLSGNVTRYEYHDQWSAPTWASGLPFGYYGDPNLQIRAANTLHAQKTFAYDTKTRIMSMATDENGVTTTYGVDDRGRRTSQLIARPDPQPPFAQMVFEETLFAYDLTQFPGFMTKKTVTKLTTDGAPAAASPALVTRYEGDSYGRVHKEIHETGTEELVTQYGYDLNNNKLSVTDPRGKTTSFVYNAQNRLVTVTYPAVGNPPAAKSKQLFYDLCGNKIKETDENGFDTLFQYDLLNRLVRQTRVMQGNTPTAAVDLVTTYGYNAVNSRTSITEPENQASGTQAAKPTTMDYDGLQRLTATTRPFPGGTTHFEYDPTQNPGSSAFDSSGFKPTKTIDPRGYVAHIQYDALYRPVYKWIQYQLAASPALALGAYSTMTYDLVGNLLMERHWLDGLEAGPTIPADLRRIEFAKTTYDALNRPITVERSHLAGSASTTQPSTVTQHLAYTSTGLKWRLTDELGRETQTYYDGMGRPLEVISPLVDRGDGVIKSPTIRTIYDPNGNVSETINPLDRHWRFDYDARNRKTVEYLPGPTGAPPGPTIYHAYDAVGNAISVTDARGFTTDTEYDQANRVVTVKAPSVVAPEGGSARPTTTTVYDRNGNVLRVTDPNGHATVNTYDVLNRLVTTTDAENILVQNEYDPAGNRTAITDGKTQKTQFTYDGLNRNTGTTDPATRRTVFAFDAINKISRTDAIGTSGQVTVYFYDLRNHLLTVSYTGRPVDNRQSGYDLAGNLLAVVEPGKGGKADVAYAYDALNRVIAETSNGQTHTHKYDLAGNRLRTEYGGTGRTLISTYDELNRLKTLSEYDSPSPSGAGRVTIYTYDANGNVLTKRLPNYETVATTYDALNRRLTISAPAYFYQQLYDLAGNLVQVQEQYPANPALNRMVTNLYDRINRLVNETFSQLAGSSSSSMSSESSDSSESDSSGSDSSSSESSESSNSSGNESSESSSSESSGNP